MKSNRPILTALAWVGAAAAVLVAMFIPLPRAVLSEEELAAGRMPQTRSAVEQARAKFEGAQSTYRNYVGSNDVGAALSSFESAVASLEADPESRLARAAVASASEPLLNYMERLADYAAEGESYFDALRYYDDELMSWTRSLGADSEVLRSATWPIVEYLKLYPPPAGLAAEYSWVSASEVVTRVAVLRMDAVEGSASALRAGAESVREAGRSIEKIESLHPQYENLLREYDDKLQAVIAARASTEPDAGRTLATVLDAGVAVLLALGIVGLLLPRAGHRRAEP
jgi:hypothetical protein